MVLIAYKIMIMKSNLRHWGIEAPKPWTRSREELESELGLEETK